jgi:hypothetical protein
MAELLDLLTDLYKTVDATRGVARRALLPEKHIDFSGPALDCWGRVLDQARLRNKIESLVKLTCQDYPEREGDLQGSLREYLVQNPGLESIRDANQGFLSLAELIRQPGVRDRVVRFQVDFRNVSGQIEVLRCYKLLHDGLHTVEFRCHLVLVPEVRKVAERRRRLVAEVTDPEVLAAELRELRNLVVWYQLDNAEIELREAIDALAEVKGMRQLPDRETAWIAILEQAWQALDAARGSKDIEPLNQGCNLLGEVIRKCPRRINDRLIQAAYDLRLNNFVQVLESIHGGLAQTGLDPRPVGSLGNGVEALRSLDRAFSQLVEEHNQWQEVDLDLRYIDEQRLDRTIIELIWPAVKGRVASLCGDNAVTDQRMQEDADGFDKALSQSNPSPSEIEQCFGRYRRQAAVQFFHVDKVFRQLLTELIKVAGPLSAVLEAIGAEVA